MTIRRLTRRAAIHAALSFFTFQLRGETVYLSSHGKFYHTRRNCIALEHASTVYLTDPQTAQLHGLKLCPICQHRSDAKKQTPSNTEWAKPEAPQPKGKP